MVLVTTMARDGSVRRVEATSVTLRRGALTVRTLAAGAPWRPGWMITQVIATTPRGTRAYAQRNDSWQRLVR
jgi:hypothetical protein